MKRSFLLPIIGIAALAFSVSASAQNVAVSVNVGGCGGYYPSGYSVGVVNAGALPYRSNPVVCYPTAPVAIYPTPYYAGYTTGPIYRSGYGIYRSPVVRVENVGAPRVISGDTTVIYRHDGRQLKLRTSR